MPPAAGQNNPAQPVQYEIKAFSLLYATGKTLPNNKPEYAQYLPESRQFTLVADAYRFALDLFTRPDAIVNRITLANRCVKAWKDPELSAKYGNFTWSGDEAKMTQYEERYRRAIHNRPPHVYVRNTRNAFGITTRMNNAKCQLEGNFDPRAMFQIKMSRKLLDALVANDKNLFSPRNIPEEDERAYNARVEKQDAEFQALGFILAVTLFHELHHGFVAYLAGDNDTFTPPTVTYMPQDDDITDGMGESGSFAERNVLGGIVVMDPFPTGNKIGNLELLTEDKLYNISYKSLQNIKKNPHRRTTTICGVKAQFQFK
ncbi:hypothetical protein DHEL01_v209668 [Diaporthe helianthi]|uniref:Uncharacterized protein n=1 Tax=Diaporthe helianthi TaxID=158607 RepID=A0A2P5HNW2_DIAHE|nr:hypothetical protein DHEL01_v209668 [Diaporthe helianthi]